MSRVKYKKTYEEYDGREVKQEDIVKGVRIQRRQIRRIYRRGL